ncbi:hypothetical protein PMAYCL1PPCAC_23462 [Pristionchus mayeri]|uniref:Uncharacterized protein n=1 Tax=Pristionchus mayeri TaxID=1317129 RepID=A0AAN5CZB0_9BILA|nr:hypothetical protein PMAYCL1PPCAC_23462 [Pristionchus mayeri]
MRIAVLFTSFLFVSSTIHRHERKKTNIDDEIDYEEDEEEEEEDYDGMDSNEDTTVAVEWVPVMSRNQSGSVYDNIHSTDREMIRKISDFLNYSYHQLAAESAAKSRDSSISTSLSFSFLPLSFSLLFFLIR